jgi:hypothetical protein
VTHPQYPLSPRALAAAAIALAALLLPVRPPAAQATLPAVRAAGAACYGLNHAAGAVERVRVWPLPLRFLLTVKVGALRGVTASMRFIPRGAAVTVVGFVCDGRLTINFVY